MISLNEKSTEISVSDIISLSEYRKIRKDHRKSLIQTKIKRRLHIGPFVVLHFENYLTLWSQVQEMLHIEGGGKEQLSDELEAYNPLVPNGNELVATMLIEIENANRRTKQLHKLGHIENQISINIKNEMIIGTPADDTERTNSQGKTSAVHFLHFNFNENQKKLFMNKGVAASILINHNNYKHGALITEDVRESLITDFS
tara:strand:- start:145 stop:747 length:603 start_codon:yes stop_codon:yes gene_type:complete